MKQAEILARAFRYFRSRRMRLFESTFPITGETRILDVGGSPAIWRFARVQPRLISLNLATAIEKSEGNRVLHVGGDGCALPFRDQSFDIVFSNSVIEHVGSLENQRRFASEVVRVGRRYWVQTPNRRGPFEMHAMLPFVHHLPKAWQRTVIERFTVWELLARPTEDQKRYFYEHVLADLLLVDGAEMRALFPGAQVLEERFLGVPKGLIAIG